MELKQPNSVLELNELYKRALLDELDTNNRSEQFVENLFERIILLKL